MNKIFEKFILAVFAILGTMWLSACGASTPFPTPPMDEEAIRTSAISTFAAGLTQTAIALPTNTPTLTPTSTSTSSTPLALGSTAVPTVPCYGLTLVSDVTIPDNTAMVFGQTFTKTWLVKNTGTCNWDKGFKFVFISGDSMGGTPLALDKTISPDAEVALSIAMTAPNKIGEVRGHWRMSTTNGTLFGDDVFVAIILSNPTGTATNTATPTPTPTKTPGS